MSPRWEPMPKEERFRSRLRPDPDTGCLEFQGSKLHNGYGAFEFEGERRAHRVAWTIAHGPIPAGLQVLHHCDNPPCCQTDPDARYPEGHLWLGTNADNKADFAAKGRGKGKPHPELMGDNNWTRKRLGQPRGPRHPDRTHCKRGHRLSAADLPLPTGAVTCRTCSNDNRRNLRHQRRQAQCRPS